MCWMVARVLWAAVLVVSVRGFTSSSSSRRPEAFRLWYHAPSTAQHGFGGDHGGVADEQKRSSQLSAKLRSLLVEDDDVASALRGLEESEMFAGSSSSFEAVLESLAPDEGMIRRIVNVATASPRMIDDEDVTYGTSTTSFNSCLEMMAKGKWLDAHEALGAPQLADVEPTCRILQAMCKHELGCPDELKAIIEQLPAPDGDATAFDLTVAVSDLARAAVARADGDIKSAYGNALSCALALSMRPDGTFPGIKTLARHSIEKADELMEDERRARASRAADEDRDDSSSSTVQVEEQVQRELDSMRRRAGDSPALNAMIDLVGLKKIKRECLNVKDAIELEVERGEDPRDKQHSIIFTGNCGTGKTTMGRLYSQLLLEVGVIPDGKARDPPKNNYVETTGSRLIQDGADEFKKMLAATFEDDGKSRLEVGDKVQVPGSRGTRTGEVCFIQGNLYDVHFGDVVEIKASRSKIRCLDRVGGTLFIDEAHQLDPKTNSVGRTILDQLTEEMDDKMGRLAVILAGNPKKIDDMLAEHDEGKLRTRFRKHFSFPDFEDEELMQIMRTELESKKAKFTYDDKYVRIASRRLGKLRGTHGFGNARAVQHHVDTTLDRQTARVLKLRREEQDPDVFEVTREDFLGKRSLDGKRRNSKALADLNALWGLDAVKESVDRLLRMVETNAEREEMELSVQEVSLNRVFLGNPGTGKTTVAHIYGRILNELGLLSKGDVIVTNPSDFVGAALGQSEAQTNAILDKSKGCVLVIDEAYGLHPSPDGHSGHADPYKSAVVDTLVSRVQGVAGEDRCVLLLGYKREMEDFVRNANPGLQRRFQLENAFNFEDYDDDALFRILARKAEARGRPITFEVAKTAVRKRLAKERMRPNFGNAGTVDNMLSDAIATSEERLSTLPPAERAMRSELIESDFYIEPAHYADPEKYVFEGLVGCDHIREKLREFQMVVKSAREQGRDPLEDLPLNFCFSGSPGTGKTTIARRMGLLFESLGVLPSSEVFQCSASDFSTGFVGQAARKTREEFERARGAVLFVDEAYRLHDPTGRSYMQEACDEIVNILTEEKFKGKMVVIFAGYPEPMRKMLAGVNPGFKSRVTELIDFPDFDAAGAAELVLLGLKEKRLGIPKELEEGPVLTRLTAKLVAAPQWANGRDVETWVRRITAECAKQGTREATAAILESTLNVILEGKYADDQQARAGVETGAMPASMYETMIDGLAPPPPFVVDTVVEAVVEAEVEEEVVHEMTGSPGDALEEACVALGYDESMQSRELLISNFEASHIPDDIIAYVSAKLNIKSKDVVKRTLRPEIPTVLSALKAKVKYDRLRDIELSKLSEADRQAALKEDAEIQSKLESMGLCPAGFTWHREGSGWRCGGGSHFVEANDPMLTGDIETD